MAQDNEPSGARRQFGDFAPALADFTDDVLFGQVWTRPELSPKERSLVTVAALTTSGNTDQLGYHLGLAQAERRQRVRTHRGDHPPGLLRRLAEGHVGDGRGQAGLPRRVTQAVAQSRGDRQDRDLAAGLDLKPSRHHPGT